MYTPRGIARATVAATIRAGRVHIGKAILSALEPLGPQQCRQEVNEQQESHNRSQQDHGASFQTLSQAATKANISPNVASPKRAMAGIQISRFIARTPGRG